MVNQAKARLFRTKQGRCWIYLPTDFCEDSAFPFRNWQTSPRGYEPNSIPVKISFQSDSKQLVIDEA